MVFLEKEGVIVGFTDETVRFNLDDSNKKEISETLTDVYKSLNEELVRYYLKGQGIDL